MVPTIQITTARFDNEGFRIINSVHMGFIIQPPYWYVMLRVAD